jgi:hypothetical protein
MDKFFVKVYLVLKEVKLVEKGVKRRLKGKVK